MTSSDHDTMMGPYPAAHHYRGPKYTSAAIPPHPRHTPDYTLILEQVEEELLNTDDANLYVSREFAQAMNTVDNLMGWDKAAHALWSKAISEVAMSITMEIMDARHEDDLPFVTEDGSVIR